MTKNVLFPGREAYEGPKAGIFGLLHHDTLWERSHDVMERVGYVKNHKLPHEVEIRLHNMIYLGGCAAAAKFASLDADYGAKRDALAVDYGAKCAALAVDYETKYDALFADHRAKLVPFDADYRARRVPFDKEIRDYILSHIPDCAWNGETLVFPSVER